MSQLADFTKPTGTSPPSDTSLLITSGYNPPPSSDVTGGGSVQPPPSPYGATKCPILRGSQTKKAYFACSGAGPAAPLGVLFAAAAIPRSLSLSRVGLCRQTSHPCQIFHSKTPDGPFPVTQNSQEKLKQSTTSSSWCSSASCAARFLISGTVMFSAAVGAAPHIVL